MSYAEVAKSAGPVKVGKLPEPAQLWRTSEPQGKIETLDGKDFEKNRKADAKEAEKIATEAIKVSKQQAEVIKKEYEEFEKKSAPYIENALGYVKKKYACMCHVVSSTFSSDSVSSAAGELQNPIVLSQLAVILAGATAGWFVYAERAYIRSNNKYVVGIHAGLVTALALGDLYVFQKLYPRYKKT